MHGGRILRVDALEYESLRGRRIVLPALHLLAALAAEGRHAMPVREERAHELRAQSPAAAAHQHHTLRRVAHRSSLRKIFWLTVWSCSTNRTRRGCAWR